MTESPLFFAFVDESGSDTVRDPGTYILSAAIVTLDVIEDVRTTMSGLILQGEKKLHWRSESAKRRTAIAEVLADLPIECLVVVRDNASADKQERRRRTCLKRMVYELGNLGATTMTLESRGSADDRRDLKALVGFRNAGIGRELRMKHLPGPAEPMLWVPDAVCGAVVGDRVGDSENWELIESRCTTYVCI